jgi:hypothetical protein
MGEGEKAPLLRRRQHFCATGGDIPSPRPVGLFGADVPVRPDYVRKDNHPHC